MTYCYVTYDVTFYAYFFNRYDYLLPLVQVLVWLHVLLLHFLAFQKFTSRGLFLDRFALPSWFNKFNSQDCTNIRQQRHSKWKGVPKTVQTKRQERAVKFESAYPINSFALQDYLSPSMIVSFYFSCHTLSFAHTNIFHQALN